MWLSNLRRLLRVEKHQWNAYRWLPLPTLLFCPLIAAQTLQAAGQLEDAELRELSGLAASLQTPGRWWALNDSGNAAVLFALDASGQSQGRLAVKAPNVDWEDLASYRDNGVAYLAISDTGDNFSLRREVSLWVLREPGAGIGFISPSGPDAPPAAPASAWPAREIRFIYDDGPRDCEALAADPARRRFLLIDKGRQPAGLYELPMDPAPGLATARRIADLPALWPDPLPLVSPIGASRGRTSVTAMDLSADGRRLLVLNYRHLFVFERHADEDWPLALRRTPQVMPVKLRLAEAAAWDAAAQALLVGGEGEHAPLLHWDGARPAP